MKKTKTKLLALLIVLALLLACVPLGFAAEVEDATIDEGAACSLTIFKYDLSNAAKDGVWDNSYTSTGTRDSYVEDILGNTIRAGDTNGSADNTLGNGTNSNGYAIRGVEFTYIRVANIVTYSDDTLTTVLYGFDKAASADLLAALGLQDGAGRYTAADTLSADCYYYTSNALNRALAIALAVEPIQTKNTLEALAQNGGTAMALTDENGRTSAKNLAVGLYLVVETKVPEMVTSTSNPFLVSLPMTTVDGAAWNYDVTVYPKNEVGIPSLEKTVRQAGTEKYGHNATGSGGDIMEYQIISTLPTITSQATGLSTYSFYDTLDEGLRYTDGAVTLEIYADSACRELVNTWDMDSGTFTVSYSNDKHNMLVNITADGLAEINSQYSEHTLRLTYTAVIRSDGTVTLGEDGNRNKVVLTWRRSSGVNSTPGTPGTPQNPSDPQNPDEPEDYYDTLVDDCHVFSFGISLSKEFAELTQEEAEKKELYQDVQFVLCNATDGQWIQAACSDSGVYYVTGKTDDEKEATIFVPTTVDGVPGQILVCDLENDQYVLTELQTADGYMLLKDSITITITAQADPSRYCGIYSEDTLGVLQNDPHYSTAGGLELHNIPQKLLLHNCISASAAAGGTAIPMQPMDGSPNAVAPLIVINNPGVELPNTGDNTAILCTALGIMLMVGATAVIIIALRKGRKVQ